MIGRLLGDFFDMLPISFRFLEGRTKIILLGASRSPSVGQVFVGLFDVFGEHRQKGIFSTALIN